jgi:tetratricopeptide (TPR) repeat protein
MMRNSSLHSRVRLPILILAVLFWFGLRAFTGQNPPNNETKSEFADPAIYLSTGLGPTLVHDRSLPLFLRVNVGNPRADNAQHFTQLQAARSANSSGQSGTARQPRPVETIRLGTAQRPLAALFSFEVRNANGDLEKVTVRPLRDTSFPNASIILSADERPDFLFGLEAGELSKLSPGRYVIRAVLTNDRAESGAWRGRVQSEPLTLDLKNADLTKEQRYKDTLQAGRFYLHDRDYDKMEAQASALLKIEGLSVSAWQLRGDAFVAQNKLDQAEQAYKEAIKIAEKQGQPGVPDPLKEPPQHLYRRLQKVEQLRQGATQNPN